MSSTMDSAASDQRRDVSPRILDGLKCRGGRVHHVPHRGGLALRLARS